MEVREERHCLENFRLGVEARPSELLYPGPGVICGRRQAQPRSHFRGAVEVRQNVCGLLEHTPQSRVQSNALHFVPDPGEAQAPVE